jgi:tRNA (guanine37-N1)-methyltransferase
VALSQKNQIILVCGHYEGIDQRIVETFNAEEISIGDYVLTGGELPAMVIADAVARNIPGVLGKAQSLAEESFQDGLLESPQYTRPRVFENLEVPAIYLSGNHKEIAAFRKKKAMEKTLLFRPDLLAKEKSKNDQK